VIKEQETCQNKKEALNFEMYLEDNNRELGSWFDFVKRR